ncbi:MAG: hypothetical protein R3E01_28110 [Pirellulaceae bacterium]
MQFVGLFAATEGWTSLWLTSIWLVGLGALLGLAVSLVLWGVIWLVRPSLGRAIPAIMTEGAMAPIMGLVVAVAVFGILGAFVARDRDDLLRSLARFPFVGPRTVQLQVPAASDAVGKPTPVGLSFRPEEFQGIRVRSAEPLRIFSTPNELGESRVSWDVETGDEFRWQRGLDIPSPFVGIEQPELFVENLGGKAAAATVTVVAQPKFPQVNSVVVTAVSVVALLGVYLAVTVFFPKVAAVGLATAKSEMAQPLFLILMILGVTVLFIMYYIPYHTFGEDIKVLKDTGFTLILVFGILQSVWSASNSVSDEVEGRTALTVLSKPIGRSQFIFGKFFGITCVVAVLFVVLGFWFLLQVSRKPIYDARESSKLAPTWVECQMEMSTAVPGLALAFLESVLFIAISIAISTRLPLLANFVICFAIYALGHLTPLIVQSSLGRFNIVLFLGQLIATIFPVLDHFNIQAAVSAGVGVPYPYLAMATLYCLIYTGIAMCLALFLFEDRDLA